MKKRLQTNRRDALFALGSVMGFAWCGAAWAQDGTDGLAAVDASSADVLGAVEAAGFQPLLTLDHYRMAQDVGQDMPPSQALLFTGGTALPGLLAADIRTALDLPFRTLSFWNGTEARTVYTNADFLRKRYGLTDDSLLDAFDADLSSVLPPLATPAPASAKVAGMSMGYGILSLETGLGFDETVARLRAIIDAQDDAIWFGAWDVTDAGRQADVDLPKATALFFGGPGPGAVAMRDFPILGLDAFCQKVLVFVSPENGKVQVVFNSISDLAKLHYGTSAEVHKQLDARITATYRRALGLDE